MESVLSNKENICVVCFRTIDIHAVGDCDHYDRVCYVCSARLRTLCEKFDCPICRKDLPLVILCEHKIPYSVLSKSKYPSDFKHRVSFQSDIVEQKYWKLQQQKCLVCKEPTIFNSFGKLKDHMRKEHELFYCDLCVDNLKLFTFERKYYNRKDLAQHRRVGDPDNTSHKGHPRCQFCDKRYLDKDELYRHLRRFHFFCHFCEADGKFEYYGDYHFLRKHFQERHFLCEEDECVHEKFTSVFKTDIDLKAHITSTHSRGLTKQQAKQARTLELEFTIVPREYNGLSSIPNYESRTRKGKTPKRGGGNQESRSFGERHYDDNTAVSNGCNVEQEINTKCQKEFPTLSNGNRAGPQPTPDFKGNKITITTSTTSCPKNYRRTFSVSNEDDFPSLDKPKNAGQMSNQASKVTVTSDSCTSGTLMLQFDNRENPNNKTQNVSIKFSSKSNGEVKPVNDVDGSWTHLKPQPPKNIEEEFPMLANTKKAGKDNCTSTMTIPISSNSAWGKSRKEANESKVPEEFEVVKTKSQKKKQKNAMTVLSSKPKSEEGKSQQNEINNKTVVKNATYVENNYTPVSSTKKTDEFDNTEVYKMKALSKPANLLATDFPPLAVQPPEKHLASSALKVPKKKEPAREPPPGYITSVPSTQPHINISLSSLAKQLSIPSTELKNARPLQTRATYSKPDNFEERNQKLITDILEILDNNESDFNEFKQASKLFRQGEVSASEYYYHCSAIFGNERFKRVLAELLVLLPDINKQQELLAVHHEECKKESKNVGTVPKNVLFMVCATCQQVLSNGDFRSHMQIHKSEPDLPTPSSDHLLTSHVNWVKK